MENARRPRYWCFAHGEEVNLEGSKDGGVMSSGQHRLMARCVFQFAKGVIANSQNTANILRHQWRLPSAKVHVVHPGVDAIYYHPITDVSHIRQMLGWEGRAVVLTVGRLQRRKRSAPNASSFTEPRSEVSRDPIRHGRRW